MHRISDIFARQILDSRGFPTVEVELALEGSQRFFRASVPSGASLGSKEAIEKRDGDDSFFRGKSVMDVVHYINNALYKKIVGLEFLDQKQLDSFLIELDGTRNKSNLGSNLTLAVSLAFAQAVSQPLFYAISGSKKVKEMPIPMLNFINGGEHAQNSLDIQEFMVIPADKNISLIDKMNIAHCIFYKLKELLNKKGYSTGLGDEGGFAPELKSSREALDLLSEASFEFEGRVKFGLDCAANSFYSKGIYSFEGRDLSSEDMLVYYSELVNDYPIISMEDPFSEHDIKGWQNVADLLHDKITVIGDDIFVTNKDIFEKYSNIGIANGILIKMNQVGTLSEAIETVNRAKRMNYKIIASHRSGETEDVSLSHLAVGIEADYIKAGSICRSERTAKYNELLRIENEYLIH